MSTPLRAPVPVPPAPPHRFPLVATVAPIVMSVVLWLVTGSPTVLLFAALGPVVAVGGLADGRLGSRRGARREEERFARELAALETAVRSAHDVERDELERAHPSAHAMLAHGDHDPDRWDGRLDELLVTLGRGAVPSAVRIAEAEDERVRALAKAAARLEEAPVAVPAIAGVAVVGDATRAGAVARSLVVQLAGALSPARHEFRVHPELAGQWGGLPHPVVIDPTLPPGCVRFRDTEADRWATIAAVPARGDAPSSTRVVVELRPSPAVTRAEDRALLGPIAPEYLSLATARAGVERLAVLARRDRVVADAALVPSSAVWRAPAHRLGRDDLRAVVGVGAGGPLEVDLVAQGPHAVVGGMTGSGKSELLVAWALGLAASHSPQQLSLLLVDFKGGASFAPLTPLPHVVGVISDLDDRLPERALASLSAEVRRRERWLAEGGVRSIGELPATSALARLVVVVDEFAAMVSDHPGLHAVFGDLAARGRSLGIHLVLCTQRPAGVVRDGVLANVGIRMSLRVNNAADSLAVVGTEAAAALPAAVPGRAWVGVDGAPPMLVQVPLAAAGDVDAVVAAWSGAPRAPRPWLAPLRERVPLAELPPGEDGIPLGVLDDPAAQAQPLAVWSPSDDGPLLVLGGPRSGRTTALEVVAAASSDAAIVAGDPEAAWDAVQRAGDEPLLLDDLDLVVARMPADHLTAFLDALALRLREAPARGRVVALTAQRPTPALSGIAAACPARLLLQLPSRQEHVVAGGEGEHWSVRAPAGRGRWRRLLVQLALPETVARRARAATRTIGLARQPLAVVSSRPRQFLERASAAGVEAVLLEGGAAEAAAIVAARPAVVVGDADAWQSAWGALASLAAERPVLVQGCTAGEYRGLLRTRELTPPVLDVDSTAVLRSPDGHVQRVALEPGF